ncbi:MAG TPA: AMP-binding protein, partial [Acidimicrobiales bacterium]|nr:AMP-binding protein [Acidimicrobiales bacterium]
GWLQGADLIMPQQYLQGAHLIRIIDGQRATLAFGVPTVWNDVLHTSQETPADLSTLRMVTVGGSAVPQALIEAFDERFGVAIVQGWGMTETSPLAALGRVPAHVVPEDAMSYRVKAGRIVPLVEARVVGPDGTILPNDGESVGEFEVRGPWVTGSYYKDDDPAKFHDGWLRTGDVGNIDALGFMQITDRTKDVIKSGGEWISSVELEGLVMAHPGVFEAAVIAVPDERWDERPLVCVVRAPGDESSAQELASFLEDKVARWWLPERWSFIDAVPKTSVGKFDKKVLRSRYADGDLEVATIKAVGGR